MAPECRTCLNALLLIGSIRWLGVRTAATGARPNAETQRPRRNAEKEHSPVPRPASACLRVLCASASKGPVMIK